MDDSVRPFKVWSCDRTLKKSITANSLAELIAKGSSKLGIVTATVVLEEDGTEVDSEDYFAFLPLNSTLILLTDGEKWRPAGKEEFGKDEPDYGTVPGGLDEKTVKLIQDLRHDISRIITFSNEQLQDLVDCETSYLSSLIGETERFSRSIQEACQRHLDERSQATQAVDLLRLYHKSQQVSPYVDDTDGAVGGDSNKRRKKDIETPEGYT